jgi:hypothetical protein
MKQWIKYALAASIFTLAISGVLRASYTAYHSLGHYDDIYSHYDGMHNGNFWTGDYEYTETLSPSMGSVVVSDLFGSTKGTSDTTIIQIRRLPQSIDDHRRPS